MSPAETRPLEPLPLYREIADQIAHLVKKGTLRAGERIPSVRKLVRQKSVSAATVVQAYQLLESRGIIEARPQSGFYVRAPRWTPLPEPELFHPGTSSRELNVTDLVMDVVGALNRPGLLNLGAAVPPADLLPLRELNRSLTSAARRHPALANACDPSTGLKSLRVEIASRALNAGCTLAPDDLVITNGLTEALHLSLRAVTRPGDIVAIESPTYFGILQLLETLGLRACEIPTHPSEGIRIDALARQLSRQSVRACVFMPNFSNPIGSCMTAENKQRLVRLLSKHQVPLIEDDIYGDLSFDAARPPAAKSFDPSGHVLWCGSFGKTLAPGYRIGWVAPGRFTARVHQLKHTCSLGNPMVTQLALAEFLANGHYERHLRHLRRTFAHSMEQMSCSIATWFPPGTRITRPRGGQVLWVELPPPVDTFKLHRAALADGISIAPGRIFSARQQYRGCMRLTFGQPWSTRLEHGLKRLGQLACQMP